MIEIYESEAIAEALAFIDRGLREMTHRTIVPSSEVADLLLDLRVILATADVHVIGGGRPFPSQPASDSMTASGMSKLA